MIARNAVAIRKNRPEVIKIEAWYFNTAVHMWRFYFSVINPVPDRMTSPNRLNYEACSRAIQFFSKDDIDIMRMYYRSKIGNYEDMKGKK